MFQYITSSSCLRTFNKQNFDLIIVKMAAKFYKKYEGQFEYPVKDLIPLHHEHTDVASPSFSPLPDSKLSFCFYASYQFISNGPTSPTSLSLLKLRLVKLDNVRVSPSLEVIVNVDVLLTNGSPFEKFPERSIKVDNMTDIKFDDRVQAHIRRRFNPTYQILMRTLKLVIKYEMVFCDILRPHILPYTEIISSNKYLDFVNNFKSMHEPSVLSDFTFKVGDKTFHVHKVILTAHSPVLKNMISQEFLESKTNHTDITDVTPEIFDTFLRYLYSCDIEDKSWDSLKELYYLADKYDVGILKNECAELSIPLLSVDLACDMLNLAYTYSDSQLKTIAKGFAVQYLSEINKKEEWKQLVTTHPIIEKEIDDFLSE